MNHLRILSRPSKRSTEPRPDEAGRAARFREQVLPHMDGAYNFARYLTHDVVAAEDIVQDAFLRAFAAFDGFRGVAPRPWLFAIVRNCFLSAAGASRARFEESFDDGSAANDRACDADDPEAALLRRDEAAALRATIADLPQPFREAIVLRELEELSYREIASVTGAPIGTVMSRLARARGMLSALLLAGRVSEGAERT